MSAPSDGKSALTRRMRADVALFTPRPPSASRHDIAGRRYRYTIQMAGTTMSASLPLRSDTHADLCE